MLLVLGITGYFGYRKLVSLRDQYTEIKPLALPVVNYSQADLDAVKKRIDQFMAVARANNTNADLSLSANDLNALLASQGLSNRIYVTLTNKSLVGQISVPLEDVGVRLFLKGRYLNGVGVFDVGCANGGLSVKVKEISVGGKALPEYYMSNIREMNYAQNITNTATKEALQRLQQVEIDDNRLVLKVGGTNQLH